MLMKRMTVRFSPAVYRSLERIARRQESSVGHLVREAVIQRYLLLDPTTRPQTLKTLTDRHFDAIPGLTRLEP